MRQKNAKSMSTLYTFTSLYCLNIAPPRDICLRSFVQRRHAFPRDYIPCKSNFFNTMGILDPPGWEFLTPPVIRRLCQSRYWNRITSRTTWLSSPGLKLACRVASVFCAPSSRYRCTSPCRGFHEWWCYCGSRSGWTSPIHLSIATEKLYMWRQEERRCEAR